MAVLNGKIQMSNCSQKSNKLIKLQTQINRKMSVQKGAQKMTNVQDRAKKQYLLIKGKGINNKIMNK